MALINTELLKYFADEFAAKITALFVKKENGKGLSSNDYTDAEKNKLAGLSKGAAGGIAELDASGKVPAAQLPSYVGDVIEGYLSGGKFYKESAHTTQITGESGKIYTDLGTNKTYRWGGSAFVVISETLALGETASTAYPGNKGKTAYEHSQSAHAPANAEANVQADWNETDPTSDAYIKDKPAIPEVTEATTADVDAIIAGTFS